MPSTRTPQSASSTTVHPQYAQWLPVWVKLAHCYEGSGGFLDGTYLVAHPREWEDYKAVNPRKPTKKLKARRTIARYENVAATILDQLKAALFRGTITRTIGKDEDTTASHPLHAWWQNVDGRRTTIDDYMALSWAPCGIYGHIVHLMDLPKAEPGETAADAPAPFLCGYAAPDMPDWVTDEYGALTAVKLLEVEPRVDIMDPAVADLTRIRVVTDKDWRLYDSKGTLTERGEHGFGTLPVVLQFANRRPLSPVIRNSTSTCTTSRRSCGNCCAIRRSRC